MIKKAIEKMIDGLCVLALLASFSVTAYADTPVKNEIKGAQNETSATDEFREGPSAKDIAATGDNKVIEMPDNDSYLADYKIMYINAEEGHSVSAHAHPYTVENEKHMPCAYHGSKVTVLAEQGKYSCVLYHTDANELRAAWILTQHLSAKFPGDTVRIGESLDVECERIGDVEVEWSNESFVGSKQKYTLLKTPADGVVRFTLDYQVTARNGAETNEVLGPRTVYINDGDGWIEVGKFDYTELGPVHIVINLDGPTTLAAVATVADCAKPDVFTYRQSVINVNGSTALCYIENGLLTITGTGEVSATDVSEAVSDRDSVFQVEIENGITAIGSSAFFSCGALTSIKLPDSVTHIGAFAFEDCTSLTSIILPASVANIGIWAFHDCSSLESITLPESITCIDNFTFANCSSLKTLLVPDGVTAIGEHAFWFCENLTSIDLPDSVVTIGTGAFNGCSHLTSLTFPAHLQSIESHICVDCKSLKNVSISDEVTSIGDWAFFNCENLESINIPNSVKSVGENAFCGCKSLRSIGLPESVTSFGSEVFSGCGNLKNITLPRGITSIGERAFDHCSELETITLPNGVTSIEEYAFYDCTRLTNINIPNSVNNIGEYAFCGCESLMSIVLPDSVTNIGTWAFNGCSSLTSIMIPAGVGKIESYTLSGCSNLTSITLADGIKEIGNGSFSLCDSLERIVFPKSVVYIGSYVLDRNTSSKLKSIYILGTPEHIDEKAFTVCYGLEDIYFGGSETQWQAYGTEIPDGTQVHFDWKG